MKIRFEIDYLVKEGEEVYILGNLPDLGEQREEKALKMNSSDASTWSVNLDIESTEKTISYSYLIKKGTEITRREWGESRKIVLDAKKNFYLSDRWQEIPNQEAFYTSAFTDSFFRTELLNPEPKYFKQSILLVVNCPFVAKGQELLLSGESDYLGSWDTNRSIRLQAAEYGKWFVVLNAQRIKERTQYKFAIFDKKLNKIVHWDEGQNRQMQPVAFKRSENAVQVLDLTYNCNFLAWKTAGVAIPVFSLRSNDSFGIGEFSDLKKMVDWTQSVGMKIIQILPINDTTITRKYRDSYPYNTISIYALHPIYLGLSNFPLKNKTLYKKYKAKAVLLNQLKEIDFEGVLALKEAYLRDLFKEMGDKIINSKDFAEFYKYNEKWLFPYACFCYLRDKYETADFSQWELFKTYDKALLEASSANDAEMKRTFDLACFTQYLLHLQLSEVKQYAHDKEVVLKGDIPIGVSNYSVEAWSEPHLFHLDTQTGAPPDDFALIGQNWGFPTYNWEVMAKDGYQWWVNRFRKMADYFDAYRIDHILGFFRIWQIPMDSVQGLLGQFSPALPLSLQEIKDWGVDFDEKRMTKPYIHEHFLDYFFAKHSAEVIEKYLNPIAWQRYELKEAYNTQLKIKTAFEGKEDEKTNSIREGLYALCNQVLFVRDKREPNKFHPRITAQYGYSYLDLDPSQQEPFNRMYDHFFFERHNEFWSKEALKKLPPLISSTRMLVCGEDLGMIPDCVPWVMKALKILSLEIQRMPKDHRIKFENLNNAPYLSVCTTATHDMSNIRLWWEENPVQTQQYYNEILWKQGVAPKHCTPELCRLILENHLNSPAMLLIIPLQDWFSIDGELRRENPEEERINIPSDPLHNWQYRMHISLEDLIKAEKLNQEIQELLNNSKR